MAAEVVDQGQQTETPRGTRPNIELDLSPKDVELLVRLRDAGVIDLDALDQLEPTDPILEDWLIEDFRDDVLGRQGLSERSAEKYGQCLIALMTHDEAPVQLRPPVEETWIEHVRWRRAQGHSGSTLNVYQAALKSLLDYLEEQTDRDLRWRSLENTFPVAKPEWTLPPDDLVPSFWHHEFFPADPLKTKLAQYLFRFGFFSGVRPPSELAALDVDDVDLDAGYLRVEQPKKGGEVNPRPDEPAHLLTAQNAKSVRVWLDHWRPRIDADTDALFPHWLGHRWIPRNLSRWLNTHGKKVWPEFVPYTMRRWFATNLLVETDINVYAVADRLGDTIATVEDRYLDRAKARAGMKADWQVPRLRRGGGLDR